MSNKNFLGRLQQSSHEGDLSKSLFARYKSFIIRGLVLIALVFMSTRMIMPMIDSIIETQTVIAQRKEKILRLSDKESFLKRQNKDKMSQQVQKLNNALPFVIDLPLILATLQKVSAETGVELGEFSLSSTTQALIIIPIPQGERFSSFQFQVNLFGSLESMEHFMEKLGTVSPMLRMDGIEFTGDKSKVLLSFYFQPQPAKAPIDAPLSELTKGQIGVINEVFSLEPPALEEPVVASPSGSRENPFR